MPFVIGHFFTKYSPSRFTRICTYILHPQQVLLRAKESRAGPSPRHQSSDLIVFLLDNLFQRLDIRHMGMRQIDL